MEYRSGPNMDPCGTPRWVKSDEDSRLPIDTDCDLPVRYDFIKATELEEK